MMIRLIGAGASLLALAGLLYTVAAALLVARFRRNSAIASVAPAPRPVTVLKPLNGDEPRLAENLASFLDQDWGAPIQLLLGVASPEDGAVAAVEALRRARPDADIELVVNPARHGANGKIGNLVNMWPRARHDLIALSDSDMAVPPGYFTHLAAALTQPGVGVATCLYRGRGDRGFWSILASAGVSYHFLPNVLASVALGAGNPCMGSTIAMSRSTLDAIGGFARFADVLADDHAIGAAVRELGLAIAVPPMLTTHASAERSLGDLARQELRWAATIRSLQLRNYVGLVITMPLPFALIGFALDWSPLSFALLFLVLSCRSLLAWQVDRAASERTAPLLLLPLRDLMTFGIFIASFFVRSVRWRGAALAIQPRGRISREVEA